MESAWRRTAKRNAGDAVFVAGKHRCRVYTQTLRVHSKLRLPDFCGPMYFIYVTLAPGRG